MNQLGSRIGASLSGLKERLQAVGGAQGRIVASLLSPLEGTATSLLSSLSALREASEASLTSFFGLLLDNTKEVRKTLEDGNLVIDLVNTLRGAECEDAAFEPPELKPATISGPAGSLTITTGSCELKRTADPLTLTYALECEAPGIEFEALVPRYTSRYVTAAEATTEECKVERKYGVESEVVVTLFNPADFFAAASAEDDADAEEEEVEAAGGPRSRGPLGVNKAAGWFNTLFPLKNMEGRKKVSFMPPAVMEAVKKAISQATVDLTLEYKPFTLKQDLIKQAADVADALSETFEVRQKVYKVWKDDLREWADPDKKAQVMSDIDFSGNLREAMAKYNVTNLFDGMFTTTASHLMGKTRLGGKITNQLPGVGGGLAESLLTDKPLRTLLSKARAGAGQPVSLRLEAGLEDALGQAREALTAATGDWASLLPAAPRKGGLMDRLMRDRAATGHMQELRKVLTSMGDLEAQLGGADVRQGSGAAAGAAAGISQAGAAAGAGADAADAVSGGVSQP